MRNSNNKSIKSQDPLSSNSTSNTENTELLPRNHTTSRKKNYLTNSSNTLIKGTKKIAEHSATVTFHLLDFMRISLVTQALLSRFLNQLFLQLKEYNLAPSKSAQIRWIPWVVIGSAALTATAVKIVNHLKKPYPAVQDFIINLFSSSFLYMSLDFLTSNNRIGAMPIWLFVSITTGFMANAFYGLKLSNKNSADRVTLRPKEWKEENYPTYPNAPKKEKVWNLINNLHYGSAAAILFWTINQGKADKTFSVQSGQLIITIISVLAYGVIGSLITEHPKLFNSFLATAKLARDGALAYNALSTIAFSGLMLYFNCPETQSATSNQSICWDNGINEKLMISLSVAATLIGIYSGMTTLVNFEKKHERNTALFEKLNKVKGTVGGYFTKTRKLLSNCTSAMFSQCKDNEAKETVPDNEDVSASQNNT